MLIFFGLYWWTSGKCKDMCICVYFEESIYTEIFLNTFYIGLKSCDCFHENKNKKNRIQTRDQNFPAVASNQRCGLREKNLKINKTGVTRFAYDSSSLLFALWWVSLWPIRICKTFLFRPENIHLHMASKSLCCSTILFL